MMGSAPPSTGEANTVFALLQAISDPAVAKARLAELEAARAASAEAAEVHHLAFAELNDKQNALTRASVESAAEHERRVNELLYRQNEIDSGMVKLEAAKAAHAHSAMSERAAMGERDAAVKEAAKAQLQKEQELAQRELELAQQVASIEQRQKAIEAKQAETISLNDIARALKADLERKAEAIQRMFKT